MKIITVEKAEVRFEKCLPGSDCKYFVTVSVEKNNHSKLLIGIKLDTIPYCWFDLQTEGALGPSLLVQEEILKQSDPGLVNVKQLHS